MPVKLVLETGIIGQGRELPSGRRSRLRAASDQRDAIAHSNEGARDHLSQRDRGLVESLNHDEVVLWFEHDLSDQLQLIQILDWFAHQGRRRTKLTLICGA